MEVKTELVAEFKTELVRELNTELMPEPKTGLVTKLNTEPGPQLNTGQVTQLNTELRPALHTVWLSEQKAKPMPEQKTTFVMSPNPKVGPRLELKPVTRNNVVHQCGKCNRFFDRKGRLNTHLRYVCGKSPPFKCPYCNYCSHARSNVYRHVRSHHKDKKVFAMDIVRHTINEPQSVVY